MAISYGAFFEGPVEAGITTEFVVATWEDEGVKASSGSVEQEISKATVNSRVREGIRDFTFVKIR